MKTTFTALAACIPLAFATPALAAAKQQPSAAAQAAEERLDHVSIVVRGSKGSPVFLIPGLATPRGVWDDVAADLARDHQVFVVQVNGFGGDDPGRNLTSPVLGGIVSDLDTYIQRRKLRDVAVIGHSMGGLAAMMLAKAKPSAAARIMVVDALPWFGALWVLPGSGAGAAAIEPQARGLRDQLAATWGKPRDPAALAAQVRGMALTPAAQPLLLGWAKTADQRVTARAMYEDLTTDLREDVAAITVPVTVLFPWSEGRFTREATAAYYRAQFRRLPQAQFVEIEASAHFVMLDQPAKTLAAIRSFLR